LTYREIQAWSELTATAIRPAEVSLIRQIDRAYLSGLAEVRELAQLERQQK
jgi:hypothetical protein